MMLSNSSAALFKIRYLCWSVKRYMVDNVSFNLLWVISGVLVLLLAVIIYLIVRLSRSEARKKEIKVLFEQIEGQVNSLQLEALESKLNPHLFKNILNRIM
jgi:H+/Cl- antiporter ClcA